MKRKLVLMSLMAIVTLISMWSCSGSSNSLTNKDSQEVDQVEAIVKMINDATNSIKNATTVEEIQTIAIQVKDNFSASLGNFDTIGLTTEQENKLDAALNEFSSAADKRLEEIEKEIAQMQSENLGN